MIDKIFIDVDGVLADFEKRYYELYGATPKDSRDRKEFSSNWKDFCETGQFEKLDWWEDGQKLLQYLESLNIPLEILSSSGGLKFHLIVELQKKKWLKAHGISYPVNIVPGRANKAKYADAKKILIDDTPDVIHAFNQAGGTGILHKSFWETQKEIEKCINT